MRKWWIFPVVIAVGATGFALLLRPSAETVPVKWQKVTLQRIEETTTCQGVIEAGDTMLVYPEVGCVIREIMVEKGQAVTANQVLATVDKSATRQMQGEQRQAEALTLAAMPEEILSPADGIVLSVESTAGAWAATDSPCVVIAPRAELQVRIAIREKDLPVLRTGQAALISSHGLGKKKYSGTLTKISSAAKTGTNGEPVVEGIVTLEDGQAGEEMRLGLTAEATMTTDVTEGGVVLPYASVLEDEEGKYFYCFENGLAMRQPIEAKAFLSQGILLADDQLVGKVILLEPEKLQPGMAVSLSKEETK